MRRKKLYRLSEEAFRAYSYMDWTGKPVTSPCDNVPMMRWPDGRWCLSANVYMAELFNRGLSRRNCGGTLLTYASQVTHLIHFCYQNKTDFIDLTDNQFTLFIQTLVAEKRNESSVVGKRETNAVIAIGRLCLDFLVSVSRFHDLENAVGDNGRIRAVRKKYVVKNREAGEKNITKEYWWHTSFPTPDVERKRLPISAENVQKLRDAVLTTDGSLFLRKRRYVMLSLLTMTGGRRSEITALTVKSVIDASRMNYPALRMITVKRRGNAQAERLVPITQIDIALLLEFINKNRRILIRKTCGHANDDGFLLVSETTGRRLNANTITQEISMLRNIAGIEEPACGHMFRHQFITNLFVSLFEQHQFENADDFRRALIDINGFKQQIREWTGHQRLESLDVYIHLAHAQYTRLKKSYDVIQLGNALRSSLEALQQMKNEIGNGLAQIDGTRQLESIVHALEHDLQRLTQRS